jgi:hypothetical protein
MPDPGMHNVGAVMPSPYEMGGMAMRDAGVSQPVPIGALATALANASPDQQRLVRMDKLFIGCSYFLIKGAHHCVLCCRCLVRTCILLLNSWSVSRLPRSLACFWRWTRRRFFTCWSRQMLSRLRLLKPWRFSAQPSISSRAMPPPSSSWLIYH